MIDTKRLRIKVLDLAIRGKLVPQDPNDEPASELLKKIKEERIKLHKEGKVKKKDVDSLIFKRDNSYYEKIADKVMCIDSEIPFDIPENWVWVRLGALGIFKKGPFGSSLKKEFFVSPNTPSRVKVYEQNNAINKTENFGRYYISREKYQSLKGFSVGEGDILVSCAGTIGEVYELPKGSEHGIINQALMMIKLYLQEVKPYFLIYFDHIIRQTVSDEGNGTGMKNIPPFSFLKKILVPVPPLTEQVRLIEKLEYIENENKRLDKNIKDLSNIANILKNKVLSLAIDGKLVPTADNSYYEKPYLLNEILPYEQPKKYIVENEKYKDSFKTPVLTAGKSFILGYTDENTCIKRASLNPVIIFDDFTTASKYVDFDFKVKSSAMKILNPNTSLLDPFFGYLLLQTIKVNTKTHKRYWISEYSIKRIKLPKIEVQKNIVVELKKIYNIVETITG